MNVKSSVKLLCVFERYIFLYAGKGGVSTVLIIAILIPVTVSLVLFCLVFCFLSRRAKSNKYSAQENDGKKL